MRFLKDFRTAAASGRYNHAFAAVAVAALMVAVPHQAWAQAGSSSDPFAQARQGANTVFSTFRQFALIVGGIGMISCLMLGFFGKLNWKWVSTGIGVSFALAIIPMAINWLNGLGGSSSFASS